MAEETERILSASRDGDIQTLQTLRRSVPFVTDIFGATALHHATRYGKLDCIKWMVEKAGMKTKVKAKNGATALHDACTQGKLLCVKYFIQECNMNADIADNSGHTPIHLAARFGYVDIVKWLITKGKCDPRLKTINRMNVLHFSAAGGHIQCLEFLISNGNNILIDERASDCTTPIFLASQNGHYPCLKYLHTVGAKCDVRSRDGMHLVHAAAQNGHLDCVGYLVVNGIASETEGDSTGATPAHYAAGEGHVSVLKWLNKRCDLNIKDHLGGTPLHDAAEKGQFTAIQYLVEHAHLNFRLKDKSQLSPIDLTEKYGHKRCHEYLKEATAKSNQLKAIKMMTYNHVFDKQTVEVNTGSSFLHVLKKNSRQAERPPSPTSPSAPPPLQPLYCSPDVSPRTSPIPCMIEYGKASEWNDLDEEELSKDYPHASEVNRSLEQNSKSQREHLLENDGMRDLSPIDEESWKSKFENSPPTLPVDAYSNNVEGARIFDDGPQEDLTEEMLDAAKKRTKLMNERLHNGNSTPSPLHNFDARSGETASRNLQEFSSKIQSARAKRSPHSTISKNDYQVLIPKNKGNENEKMKLKESVNELSEFQNDSPMEYNDVAKPIPRKTSFEEKMLPPSENSSPKPVAMNPSPPIPQTLTDIFEKPKSPSPPAPIQKAISPSRYASSSKPQEANSKAVSQAKPAVKKPVNAVPVYGPMSQDNAKLKVSTELKKEPEVDENKPPIDQENYMTTDDETDLAASLPRPNVDKDALALRSKQLKPLPHMNETTPEKIGNKKTKVDEETWTTLPEWKRQVLRNRIMKEQQAEMESRKQEEEELSSCEGVSTVIKRINQQEKLAHLPEWKRQLILKKRRK